MQTHRRTMIIVSVLIVSLLVAVPLLDQYYAGVQLPPISVSQGNSTYSIVGDFIASSSREPACLTWLNHGSSTTWISEPGYSNSSLALYVTNMTVAYLASEGPQYAVFTYVSIVGNLSSNLNPSSLIFSFNSSGPPVGNSSADMSYTQDVPEPHLTSYINLSGPPAADHMSYFYYGGDSEKLSFMNLTKRNSGNVSADNYHFALWNESATFVLQPPVQNATYYIHFQAELKGLSQPVVTNLWLRVTDN